MKAFIPEIVNLPDRKVLTITTIGDPNTLGNEVFSALYGTSYSTRFKIYKPRGFIVKFGKLTARWPDAHLLSKSLWTGIWAIPVPDFYQQDELIQKDPKNVATVDIWPGGVYAQILHKGKYTDEGPTVEKLHAFIKSKGIDLEDVLSPHEEEYLTSQDAKEIKTIIRYRIK